jgi:hypothetical protein
VRYPNGETGFGTRSAIACSSDKSIGSNTATIWEDFMLHNGSNYEFIPSEDRFRRLDKDIHQEGIGYHPVIPLIEIARGMIAVLTVTESGGGARGQLYLSMENGSEWIEQREPPVVLSSEDDLWPLRQGEFAHHGPDGFSILKVAADGEVTAKKVVVEDADLVTSCASPEGTGGPVIYCLRRQPGAGYMTRRGQDSSTVLRSGDGGATFKVMGRVDGEGVAVVTSDGKRILAGTSYSVDGGWTWKAGFPGIREADARMTTLLGVFASGQAIYRRPGEANGVDEVVLASADLSSSVAVLNIPKGAHVERDETGAQLYATSPSAIVVCSLADLGTKFTRRVGDVNVLDAACRTLPVPPGGIEDGHILASKAIPGALYMGGSGLGMLYLAPNAKQWKRMEGF